MLTNPVRKLHNRHFRSDDLEYSVKLRIPPPIIMLVGAALMWMLHHWLPVAYWLVLPWNVLGLLVGGVAITASLSAFWRFRRVGTTVNPIDLDKTTQLVTDGIFSVSRNPMYLGLFLMLVAWGIWLGSASVWLIPPLFVILITIGQIIPEEQALTELFGAQYLSYKRDVARWIGRPATRQTSPQHPLRR
jgi:protein-S-isoprenylcysteine O-methyltransferase Ste14